MRKAGLTQTELVKLMREIARNVTGLNVQTLSNYFNHGGHAHLTPIIDKVIENRITNKSLR